MKINKIKFHVYERRGEREKKIFIYNFLMIHIIIYEYKLKVLSRNDEIDKIMK